MMFIKVLRRREEHGYNELLAGASASTCERTLRQLSDPLLGLLLVSAAVSAALRRYQDAVLLLVEMEMGLKSLTFITTITMTPR